MIKTFLKVSIIVIRENYKSRLDHVSVLTNNFTKSHTKRSECIIEKSADRYEDKFKKSPERIANQTSYISLTVANTARDSSNESNDRKMTLKAFQI